MLTVREVEKLQVDSLVQSPFEREVPDNNVDQY